MRSDQVLPSAVEAIGRTPLVELDYLNPGFSSGANLAATLQLLAGPGQTIAILMCDSGLKYLSTNLWD